MGWHRKQVDQQTMLFGCTLVLIISIHLRTGLYNVFTFFVVSAVNPYPVGRFAIFNVFFFLFIVAVTATLYVFV